MNYYYWDTQDIDRNFSFDWSAFSSKDPRRTERAKALRKKNALAKMRKTTKV